MIINNRQSKYPLKTKKAYKGVVAPTLGNTYNRSSTLKIRPVPTLKNVLINYKINFK